MSTPDQVVFFLGRTDAGSFVSRSLYGTLATRLRRDDIGPSNARRQYHRWAAENAYGLDALTASTASAAVDGSGCSRLQQHQQQSKQQQRHRCSNLHTRSLLSDGWIQKLAGCKTFVVTPWMLIAVAVLQLFIAPYPVGRQLICCSQRLSHDGVP
jgi:hypothetical protein